MSKLLKFLKPYRWLVALVFLLMMVESMAALYLPTIMADIVNNGIIRAVTEGTPQQAYIIQRGLLMLLVTLGSGLAAIGAGYFAPRVAAGFARDLRRDIFVKVESFSQKEFDTFSASSLITRCTNDVAQVQNLIGMSSRMLFFAPIMAIGGVVMALNQSVSMSWIIALAVIVLFGFVGIIIPVVMPRFRLMQGLMDKLNKVAREMLHGLMVIRAFNAQKHEIKRFDEVNTEIFDISLFVARVMGVAMPMMMLIMSGTQILVVWVGAHQIAAANLQIGDMMAFMQYAMAVIFSFMMITMLFVMIPRALVSAGRIAEVLDTEPSITDPSRDVGFTEKGVVVFDDVSFSYPNAETNALSSISFTAKPGQTTAVIGPTGSGKSTIAQLLLRLYDVSSGSVKVNGADIREVTQKSLREKIGYVPQKGQLISGTIASNIKYGQPDVSDDELKKVAEVAQALSFIEEKEMGFEAEIGQKGGNVSGGQRQRLSIARALAKKPDILVFDDSFSALDFQTDLKLRQALKSHVSDATLIIIAQRVGTIMNAEQILVLEEGRIVGRGTHEELLKNCLAYKEIASSQGVE